MIEVKRIKKCAVSELLFVATCKCPFHSVLMLLIYLQKKMTIIHWNIMYFVGRFSVLYKKVEVRLSGSQ